MYQPTIENVINIANQGYNLIPIYREINADLETPVSVYLKIARDKYSFLLESVEGGERQARFSFIGCDPYKVIETGKGTIHGEVDPLNLIESELCQYKAYPSEDLPRFVGGAVGYLSYDTIRYFEPRINLPEYDPIGIPESILLLTDTVIVFDHIRHVIKIVSHVRTNGNIQENYNEAVYKIENILEDLSKSLTLDNSKDKKLLNFVPETKVNFELPEYSNIIEKCRDYIIAGDVIQVVVSKRTTKTTQAHPFNIYRSLRKLNPSPYMYYLNFGDFNIIGASPEALVRVEDGFIYSYPLAGTSPRGSTNEQDQEFENKLLADEKERAEHIMLVDLARNDVGRVAQTGSVEVVDLMRIVKYSHVMHIESEVRGILREDCTIYDALRSCLPAGTLSGAPKVRAMEIIYEMEKAKRGPYGGAIGYFSFNGNMDTAIPIRTIVYKDNTAYIQAGGGIVFDSESESEYQETINKASAPLRAIENADEFDEYRV
ncbi:MAG: anthranilate synthase component I [Dehalococcoidia bacterium]